MVEVPLFNGDMVRQMHVRVRYIFYCCVRFLTRKESELLSCRVANADTEIISY